MNEKKCKIVLPRVFLLIFSIIFIASLFMGITALAENNPFNIKEAVITDKSENVTGNISTFGNDKISDDIVFHKLNDSVTYKLVIKSNVEKDITILSITDDNNSEYISYEYDKHENEKLSVNSSFDFIVKAIYKNEVNDISKREQASDVKFTITYLEDGEVKGDTIVINPKTGDGIGISFILLVVSSTGLIICIVLDKRKKLSKMSVLILTGLVLSPIVVKAASIAFGITIKSNIYLYDKIVVTLDNGSSKITKIIEYGEVVDDLPEPTREGYTFVKWINDDGTDFDGTKIVDVDKKITAVWSANDYTITFDTDGGSTINPITQSYDTNITAPSNPTKEGYTFAGWEPEIPSKMPAENKTVKAKWTINQYTITFDTDGGSTVNPITQNYDTNIIAPSDPTKEGYTFAGWEPEIPSKMPAENKTVKAKWTKDDSGIICKRATILTHETCNISNSTTEGCRGDQYGYGDPISYGSIILSDELTAGNALDCNVDGTGYNQRFYYVRTLNGNAVLISNINYEGDDGQGYNNNYIYDEAPSKLPRKADQWTNVPITFTHEGDETVYAARFITMDDLKTMTQKDNLTASNVFNNPYNFIFENTSYANVAVPEYRSTVWIEEENGQRQRYHKKNRSIEVLNETNYNTSKNSVRPVIEVPLDKIDITYNTNEATLMFDSLGGTAFDIRSYEKGTVANDLPEPTRDGYDFKGWFKEKTFENEFKNGDTISEDTILYAKWSLTNATVEYNNQEYISFLNAISQIKNGNEVEIKLLKDTSEKVSIPSGRNIIINLNGHTITNDGDNQVVYNQGTAKVMNGTITTTAGTKAAIDNNTSNYVIVENVTINANGSRSAIYNTNGTVIIDGGSTISISNNLRPTVMNTCSTCVMNIVDATITSDEKNAVDNNGGTLIIGKTDTDINASTPVIIGGSYGIASNSNVQMYDGIIKGKLAPVYNGKASTSSKPITYSGGAVNNDRIIASEPGFKKATGIDGEYYTLYLEAE